MHGNCIFIYSGKHFYFDAPFIFTLTNRVVAKVSGKKTFIFHNLVVIRIPESGRRSLWALPSTLWTLAKGEGCLRTATPAVLGIGPYGTLRGGRTAVPTGCIVNNGELLRTTKTSGPTDVPSFR